MDAEDDEDQVVDMVKATVEEDEDQVVVEHYQFLQLPCLDQVMDVDAEEPGEEARPWGSLRKLWDRLLLPEPFSVSVVTVDAEDEKKD